MFTDPEPHAKPPEPPRDLPHKILRYTWIAVVIAAIYAVAVLAYRWQQNSDYQARVKQQAAAAQREEDQQSLDTLGGTEFKIVSFYAMPGHIHRGDTVQLCYGVANAQSVTIQPDTGRQTWPSLTRCIEISPKKTTTYVLTAKNANGKTQTASLTINVQ
ncbi:MAG TPA: hypothetical protein VMF66_17305 [Candidatus Acidoferrum sp.]|nr:hypothetical protein [Candidatus Acidoferrum sp.]